MNKEDKKKIEDIINKMSEIIVNISSIKCEELTKLENMSSKFFNTERYNNIEESINAMDDAMSLMSEAKDILEETI